MEIGQEVAGRYRLVSRLGKGSFGEVWKAVDLLRDRPVALKFLHSEAAAADPMILTKFRQEARIAVRLEHAAITSVSDFGEHRGRWFLAMELLEGNSLLDEMARRPDGLSLTRTLSLGRQILEGIVAAHAHGVIHRDLKPANLMLIEADRIKICDFGIAQIVDSPAGDTFGGRSVGTPLYMAPEQWRGLAVDRRTDLYAFGAILYVLLTGRPPFLGGTVYELMEQHLKVTPVDPRRIRQDIPAPLAQLVMALLAKDPADRPADAAQVLHGLEPLRQDSSTRVDRPRRFSGGPAAETPAAPRRRYRRRTVLAGGAASILGISTVGLFRLVDDGPSKGTATPTPHKPRVDPGYANDIRPIRADATVHTLADLFPPAPSTAIALTLDDGPDPTYTPMLLDLLAEFQVQATFSVIGEQLKGHPKIIQRISDAGHQLANHSVTHPLDLAALPPKQINREIIDCYDQIAQATGTAPRYFRSPGGNWNSRITETAAAYNMICLDWSIDPRDWAEPHTDRIASALTNAKSWDILLCHDGGGDRGRTVAALRIAIPELKASGFSFIVL